jgi:hypothetical protein
MLSIYGTQHDAFDNKRLNLYTQNKDTPHKDTQNFVSSYWVFIHIAMLSISFNVAQCRGLS